jgi:hypothetical protein
MGYAWFRHASLVCWQSRLVLNTVLGSCDVLHVGAVHLLIVVIIVGHSCNPPMPSLSPLLAVLGVLLGTLDDKVGWSHFVAIRDCFPTTGDGEGPDRLLTCGVLGGDAEQLLDVVPNDIV